MSEKVQFKEHVILGSTISRGVVFGYAHFEDPFVSGHSGAVSEPVEVEREIRHLGEATDMVRSHLNEHVRYFHSPVEEDVGHIVAAHLMILEDTRFFSSIKERIKTKSLPAHQAVRDTFLESAKRLVASDDPYLRARAEDLKDLCQNLQRALIGGAHAFDFSVTDDRPLVFVGEQLHLSAVLRAKRQNAVAFLSRNAAYTSHGAILLRASSIPSIGNLNITPGIISEGSPLLIDAGRGEVIVHPDFEMRKMPEHHVATLLLEQEQKLPVLNARLPKGGEVKLQANITHPSQVALCHRYQLSGVGLFRTEFMVLDVNYFSP